MADRIAVLRAGRIEQVGDPLTLYDEPANEFVARFIGSPPMNLIDARWAQGQLALGDGTSLPPPPGTAGRHGDAVRLGVRPEHLMLRSGDEPLPPGAAQLRLQVSAVDYLGSITELHGTVSGTPGASLWLARLTGRYRARKGDEVVLVWDPERSHVFDPTSGRRLPSAPAPAAFQPERHIGQDSKETATS